MNKNLILIATACGAVAAALLLFPLRKDVSVHRSSPPAVKADDSSPKAEASDAERIWKGLIDPSLPRDERMTIAREIRPGLDNGETQYLFAILSHRAPGEDKENWWLIVNEIMERMRKQGVGADDYTTRLAMLIADASADEVVRDYAIQHLGQWLAPAVGGISPGEPDEAKRTAGLQVIVAAIKDPSLIHSVLPGTGLLTLADATSRLKEQESEAVWAGLRSFLQESIEGRNEASVPIRASSIQAAARAKRGEFLPAIRVLAFGGVTDPSIRLSSIHAVGRFAIPEDREALMKLASLDSPYQYAARAALQQYP